MIYNKIVEATFLNRPNRFIAQVLIEGREERVHVKTTGRLWELLLPGARLILEDCSQKSNRKTRYSLIAVWKGDMLVNVDSQIPNHVVYDSLQKGLVPGLENLDLIQKEVSFSKSRFDLYFQNQKEEGFIEVKGVTLEKEGMASFPGAPTSRGSKHVLDLIKAKEEGYRAIIFFLVQMTGPKLFSLHWEMDQAFCQAVRAAHGKGVEILAYDSLVGEDSISLGQPLDIRLDY